MTLTAFFDLLSVIPFMLIWAGVIIFQRKHKKIRVIFLFFSTIFFIYIYKVLDYTLFQFQSLLLLKYFMPHLMLRGVSTGNNLNLIPLVTLTSRDLNTSLLNILLFIPFGFGLPFITDYRVKKVVSIGAMFSLSIEGLQYITGLMANMTYRIADINDVLFNTSGVIIGYLLFKGFVIVYMKLFHKRVRANPISKHIANRPQVYKEAMRLD